MSEAAPSIVEQLRAAVRRAEATRTRYKIALDCGIDRAQLHRFMEGDAGLRLVTAEKLARGLGFNLKLDSAKRR